MTDNEVVGPHSGSLVESDDQPLPRTSGFMKDAITIFDETWWKPDPELADDFGI